MQGKADWVGVVWWFGPKTLRAVEEAEAMLGRPPKIYEVVAVKQENSPQMMGPMIIVLCIFFLFKEGRLFTDKDMSSVTVHEGKHEGFMGFREKWDVYHKGYTMNYYQRIIATPRVKVVNLN